MTRADIPYLRLCNERLAGAPIARPEDVVSWLGAVQSQDYAGAKWGLAQRCAGDVTSAQIDALFNAGKILRTHVMRPTWHFVAPEDLRWLLKLTAPRVRQVNSYMDRQLEIDAAVLRKGARAIEKALSGGGQMTREELAEALKKARIVASGPRLAYIVMNAELDGLICSGPLKGKQFTYALLEERVPKTKTLSREESLAELARRFFTSHGPARAQDFAWWSGLTMADVRAGLEMNDGVLAQEIVDGEKFWFSPSAAAGAKAGRVAELSVYLLPNYDEFVVAYRDGFEVLAPDVRENLKKRAGALMVHIIIADGRVVGGWRRTIGKREIAVETDLLTTFSKKQHAALKRAAEKYAWHMEMPVRVAAD